jgi:hypothetical protein
LIPRREAAEDLDYCQLSRSQSSPMTRETACLPYRILSAWLYFLAMNNLLAGQQATRRRASKTGTEEGNITTANSTHKNKEEGPRAGLVLAEP